MTAEKIQSLSYTDFVGFINQWNVLPGAYDTLNRWRVFSDLTGESNVLDIACTTGFSSREIALMTEASCHGIDISGVSIRSAEANRSRFASGARLSYEMADGIGFQAKGEKYTHIIIGASLKFFKEPAEIISKINTLLCDGGYLLASPFYTIKVIPDALISKARATFGITITTESYKDIMWMYKDFEILYQEKKILEQETLQELQHYCMSTIALFKENNPNLPDTVYDAVYNRLMQIKEMSNELRPYQGYIVLVLRSRNSLFGKRLVELF